MAANVTKDIQAMGTPSTDTKILIAKHQNLAIYKTN